MLEQYLDYDIKEGDEVLVRSNELEPSYIGTMTGYYVHPNGDRVPLIRFHHNQEEYVVMGIIFKLPKERKFWDLYAQLTFRQQWNAVSRNMKYKKPWKGENNAGNPWEPLRSELVPPRG